MIPVSAAFAAVALTTALILEAAAGQVTLGRVIAVTGLVFLVAAILSPPRR